MKPLKKVTTTVVVSSARSSAAGRGLRSGSCSDPLACIISFLALFPILIFAASNRRQDAVVPVTYKKGGMSLVGSEFAQA